MIVRRESVLGTSRLWRESAGVSCRRAVVVATVPERATAVRLCVRRRGDERVRLVAWCSRRRTARRDGVEWRSRWCSAPGPAADSRSRARHHGFERPRGRPAAVYRRQPPNAIAAGTASSTGRRPRSGRKWGSLSCHKDAKERSGWRGRTTRMRCSTGPARAAATGRMRFGRVDGAAAERWTRVFGLGVRKAVMTVSSGRRAASRTEMVRLCWLARDRITLA